MLRDTANRLNIEIHRAQEELRAAQKRDHTAEKTKAELQQVNISLLAFLGRKLNCIYRNLQKQGKLLVTWNIIFNQKGLGFVP